ncbi:glutathione S-transferase family protein [Histidinibacterium lentulum]|uniref:Glutathione S-transferase family protein n=1 Tax=Histidinibacterium lentulum TaxID=2480588 RepID=A0A3N2QR81_9RHOB|nr:glutathione S-transferase family protein [Histidinibacterium lentulum]ROT97716.1 glutathione S-transferase family protein [Histidinibacterium lentulum]
MTTLCYAKKTCAIGIHVLMEEIGAPYDLRIVDFSKKEQKSPDYLALNPKGKVAALVRDDGSVVTEFAAIAMWLALQHPEKNLMPTDPEGMIRTIEALDYVVGTVHMLSWRMYRRPDAYSDIPEAMEQLKQRGRDAMMAAFEVVDAQLAGREWMVGERLTLADAALYYNEYWAVDVAGWELPPNVAAHFERMKERPSVQANRVLEGVA